MAREIARLNDERTALKDLVTQKKALVSQGTADLEAERKRTADLAEKAKSLKQLLSNLDAPSANSRSRRQGRGAAPARAARKPCCVSPRLPSPTPGASCPSRPRANRAPLRRAGRAGPRHPGRDDCHQGHAQVTTPADGKVDSRTVPSYGQVVILNPGGGYRLLLAGMDKVTAERGRFLRAGEPVGEMGSGPASVTLFGDVVPTEGPCYISNSGMAQRPSTQVPGGSAV